MILLTNNILYQELYPGIIVVISPLGATKTEIEGFWKTAEWGNKEKRITLVQYLNKRILILQFQFVLIGTETKGINALWESTDYQFFSNLKPPCSVVKLGCCVHIYKYVEFIKLPVNRQETRIKIKCW
jgi:hypothetical protein